MRPDKPPFRGAQPAPDQAQSGPADTRPPAHSTETAARAGQPGRPRPPVCLSSGRRARVRRFRIASIICGIDQVVLRFDPRVASRIERRHHLREGSLLDTLVDMPTAKLASVGAISHERWLRYAHQSLPPPAVDEWLSYHGTLNRPVVDILTSATLAGVRLFFLANKTAARLSADLAHHDLGDLAEETWCSAEIGYAMPDPRIYEHVIDAARLRPPRTLYVDCSPSWVRVGRQLGMRGHRYTEYTGAAALRDELLRAGVRV